MIGNEQKREFHIKPCAVQLKQAFTDKSIDIAAFVENKKESHE